LTTTTPPAGGLRCAVFLDRDGVLNEVTIRDGIPVPPPSADAMELIEGVEEACARLRELGFVLVVITNQPDIARGAQTRDEVDRMHALLRRRLPLDEIIVCPHDDRDGCACRKPKPGMILDAAGRLGLDLDRSFSVGDRWRDVEAAQRAGVRSIFVERHYGQRPAVDADAVAASLLGALPYIEFHAEKGVSSE
jgi:D-glycero-D-manno-heptose 1,7-bisphosphate phosphatase